ncbi:hypothetical protein J2Y64_001925 [Aeromonas salmonicida]|nr:hypothetical protein [Aeromonas salmonicida]
MNAVICGQPSSMVLTLFNDRRERTCRWVSDAMIKGAN